MEGEGEGEGEGGEEGDKAVEEAGHLEEDMEEVYTCNSCLVKFRCSVYPLCQSCSG